MAEIGSAGRIVGLAALAAAASALRSRPPPRCLLVFFAFHEWPTEQQLDAVASLQAGLTACGGLADLELGLGVHLSVHDGITGLPLPLAPQLTRLRRLVVDSLCGPIDRCLMTATGLEELSLKMCLPGSMSCQMLCCRSPSQG